MPTKNAYCLDLKHIGVVDKGMYTVLSVTECVPFEIKRCKVENRKGIVACSHLTIVSLSLCQSCNPIPCKI